MIPYDELSAALERWRIRNGLPGTPPLFAEGSAMKRTATAPAASYSTASASGAASYSAPAVSYSAPAAASYSPPPGPPTAPPRVAPAMPPPPSPETLDEDVGEFAEDDVLGEAELDNDGPDFAHAFSGPPPGAAAARSAITAPLSADEEREATLLGATDPGIVPPPLASWPESASDSPDTGRQAAVVIDDGDEFDEKTPA